MPIAPMPARQDRPTPPYLQKSRHHRSGTHAGSAAKTHCTIAQASISYLRQLCVDYSSSNFYIRWLKRRDYPNFIINYCQSFGHLFMPFGHQNLLYFRSGSIG